MYREVCYQCTERSVSSVQRDLLVLAVAVSPVSSVQRGLLLLAVAVALSIGGHPLCNSQLAIPVASLSRMAVVTFNYGELTVLFWKQLCTHPYIIIYGQLDMDFICEIYHIPNIIILVLILLLSHHMSSTEQACVFHVHIDILNKHPL